MGIRRARVVRVLLVTLLTGVLVTAWSSAGVAARTASAASAETAGLTSKSCTNVFQGDRRLVVCTRGYIGSDGSVYAETELHSYAWASTCPSAPNPDATGCWVDSRSKLLRMNGSLFQRVDPNPADAWWGYNEPMACRANGIGGVVACSISNAVSVALYSYGHYGASSYATFYTNRVDQVSWIDDRGVSHTVPGLGLAHNFCTNCQPTTNSSSLTVRISRSSTKFGRISPVFHAVLHDFAGLSCGTLDLYTGFDVHGAGGENALWFNYLGVNPQNFPAGHGPTYNVWIDVVGLNPYANLDHFRRDGQPAGTSANFQPDPHPKKYRASSGSTFPSPSVIVQFTVQVGVPGHGTCSTGNKAIYFQLS